MLHNIVEIEKQSKEVQDHIHKHIESVKEQADFIRKKIEAGQRVKYNLSLLEKHVKVLGMYERGLFEFSPSIAPSEYFEADVVLIDKESVSIPESASLTMDISLDKGDFGMHLLDIDFIKEMRVNKDQFEAISEMNHERVVDLTWYNQLWCGVMGYGIVRLK